MSNEARYDFRTQRLFVNDNLQPGGELIADKAHANYLTNVLRLKNGSQVLLFNGRDGEWRGELAIASRKDCRIIVNDQTRAQPEAPTLRYCFAPLKQARLDYMVQKATEMGAGHLQPVLTHHTQVTRLNIERMQANAVEAAEQCGVLSVPKCHEPVKLDRFLDQWPSGENLIFCDESAGPQSPIETLSNLPCPPGGLLIGPEGGFSTAEREILRARDQIIAISLGPRILRADTAAVAALAVIQATRGDWTW